jgi:hypothetical protein
MRNDFGKCRPLGTKIIEEDKMRCWLILILIFFIFSCEKNYESLGEDDFYLETSQDSYLVGDTVKIYLVKNSEIPLYYELPGGFSKKIDDSWSEFDHQWLSTIPIIPSKRVMNSQRILVISRTFQDSGLFKYRLYISRDNEENSESNLGYILSNIIEIRNGF